jgi:hypothetical protein
MFDTRTQRAEVGPVAQRPQGGLVPGTACHPSQSLAPDKDKAGGRFGPPTGDF